MALEAMEKDKDDLMVKVGEEDSIRSNYQSSGSNLPKSLSVSMARYRFLHANCWGMEDAHPKHR